VSNKEGQITTSCIVLIKADNHNDNLQGQSAKSLRFWLPDAKIRKNERG
jgi:hypothetical protein